MGASRPFTGIRVSLPLKRMSWKRAVVALTFGALALLAVSYYGSEEATNFVEESFPVDSQGLPKDVDSFVEVSMNKGKSFDPWRQLVAAKKAAKAKASPKAYKAAEANCALFRSAAYRKCGVTYCKAKKKCGKPCKKLFGEPPLQVVPLTPGGPKFYKVHEVAVKENKAKEARAKEKAAKEKAKKEKKAKEKAHKERAAKEKIEKEKTAKERKKKEKQEKARERARKKAILIKCTKRGDAAEAKCEKAKAKELNIKSQEKAAKAKKAKKASLKEKLSKKSAKAAASYASAVGKEGKTAAAYQSAKTLRGLAKAVGAKDAFASASIKEIHADEAYASKAIPAGGAEETQLLQVNKDKAAKAAASAAKAAKAAKKDAVDAKIKADNAGIAKAKAKVKAEAKVVDDAVDAKAKAKADYASAASAAIGAKERIKDHIIHATLAKSQVKAVDTYVATHRGKKHMKSCKQTKKYFFDVCYGRAKYRSQLLQTKMAKEARSKVKAFKG